MTKAGVTKAYVALGANLGDASATLRAALDALDTLAGVRVLDVSSFYRTAPLGLAQPDFVNAVVALESALLPRELLAGLLAIEARFGRVRSTKNAPRTLDLDLLLYGDCIINDPDLVVPHPRMHLRAFVLRPLAEIAPGLLLPGRGALAAWLPAVALQSAEVISSPQPIIE